MIIFYSRVEVAADTKKQKIVNGKWEMGKTVKHEL